MARNDKLAETAVVVFLVIIALVRVRAFGPLVLLLMVFGSTVWMAWTRWPEPDDRKATLTLSILAALFLILIGSLFALGRWLSAHQ